MAKIGDIYLGGAEGSIDQKNIQCGIGFFLTSDSKISNILSLENGKWNVEIKEGQQSIVARCKDVLSEDEILEQGFKYCQQAIDFMSIKYLDNFNIKEAGNFHTILYKKDDEFFLKQVQTAFSTFKAKVSVQAIDTNTGNIIPQPVPSEPEWTAAFRYYRLSQNTNDLYEAYKNAYLSFEYLLNEIFPNKKYKQDIDKYNTDINKKNKDAKKKRYVEEEWFISALKDADSKYKLINYIPKGETDAIENFVKKQYVIRCKLFHAKGDQCLSNIIVPSDSFNPTEVSDAYEELMILLKQILINYYNIRPQDSGMTYNGFKTMMEGNLSIGCLLYINDDNSSNTGNLIDRYMLRVTENQLENDKQLAQLKKLVSPKKFMDNPSLDFDDPALLVQPNINDTGIFKISCEVDKNELVKIPLIHRTSLIYEIDFFGKIIGVTIFNNRDGLHLDGIDKFETNIYIKLKNIGDHQK